SFRLSVGVHRSESGRAVQHPRADLADRRRRGSAGAACGHAIADANARRPRATDGALNAVWPRCLPEGDAGLRRSIHARTVEHRRCEMTWRPSAATRAVRAGLDTDTQHGAVVPPLHLTSTFSFKCFGERRAYDYSRSGNPTR